MSSRAYPPVSQDAVGEREREQKSDLVRTEATRMMAKREEDGRDTKTTCEWENETRCNLQSGGEPGQ